MEPVTLEVDTRSLAPGESMHVRIGHANGLVQCHIRVRQTTVDDRERARGQAREMVQHEVEMIRRDLETLVWEHGASRGWDGVSAAGRLQIDNEQILL